MNAVQFRVEFGTDVECEPTSIVPIFQTSTRGAGSVVVSASDWHAGGPGLYTDVTSLLYLV